MKILGISAHYHDSAAALLIDGVPLCAVQEERLSRRKNDAAFPLQAIEWCLERGGIEPEQLDAVVFYERPMLKFERVLTCLLRAFPRSFRSFPRAMRSALGEKVWVKGIIASQLGVRGDRILFTDHHQAHAATAFLCSPSKEAAILTADGVGEWATLTVGRGARRSDGKVTIDLLREIRYPHSLGMLYSTFTAFLGFAVNEGEYKVMGLAAYGTPRYADAVNRIVQRTADGGFALDLSYFDYHTTAARSYSARFVREFGAPRLPHEPLDLDTEDGRRYADLAASVQLVLEEVMVGLCQKLQRETGLSELCLGGGVALNGCANARILRESGFQRVLVPPAPGLFSFYTAAVPPRRFWTTPWATSSARLPATTRMVCWIAWRSAGVSPLSARWITCMGRPNSTSRASVATPPSSRSSQGIKGATVCMTVLPVRQGPRCRALAHRPTTRPRRHRRAGRRLRRRRLRSRRRSRLRPAEGQP